MTASLISQQILSQVNLLSTALASHIAEGTGANEKINAVYKIIVSGNGDPPLPEIVRRHEEWITERDAERAENKQDKKNAAAKNSANSREDRNEAIAFKRQLWLLLIGELLIIAGLGIAAFLGWR